jgi:hypothetical protein
MLVVVVVVRSTNSSAINVESFFKFVHNIFSFRPDLVLMSEFGNNERQCHGFRNANMSEEGESA